MRISRLLSSIKLFKIIFAFFFSWQKRAKRYKMLDFINILSISFNVNTHPLHTVVFYENTELFDQVMKSGHYNIDDPIDPDGSTPLHLAIVFETPKMVRHLLEKWKADPTKPDGRGRTAINLAALCAQENIEQIIDLLLEHEKVDINERDLNYGRTALHLAVWECNSFAVGHLIDKGADPNIKDKDGQSPLHLAACHENGTEMIDLILKVKKTKKPKQNDEGIDDSVYEFGKTALHMAVAASNLITVEYSIEKGAHINYRDKDGRTPIILAAFKIINLLWKNIKKEDVEQHKGKTKCPSISDKRKKCPPPLSKQQVTLA